MPKSNTASAKVKFINLTAQHRALKQPLLRAMTRVLESSRFILGPETRALEQDIAKLCAAREAVGVNSGTDALVLVLRGLGIGPGDEVLVPDYTFVATASAVLLAGAKPVLVDVEPHTLTLDPEQAARRITRRTRALIPVHLYGQPADMTALLALAKKHGLAVIEDAAQSLGAAWQGRPVGALGAAGCFSFFPTKNLGGLGDGGMVVTNDQRLAQRLRRLRDHGAEEKYLHLELGYNSRLDDIHAAALRVKLQYLRRWNERRRAIAAQYSAALAGLGPVIPLVRPEAVHVFHQYVIRMPKREALRKYLSGRGIETALHYPLPLHRQPMLMKLGLAKGGFPVSEQAAREVLCLPIVPETTDREVKRVTAAIQEYFGHRQ